MHIGDDAVNAMNALVRPWGDALSKDADPQAIFAQVERARPSLISALKPYLSEKATTPPLVWTRPTGT